MLLKSKTTIEVAKGLEINTVNYDFLSVIQENNLQRNLPQGTKVRILSSIDNLLSPIDPSESSVQVYYREFTSTENINFPINYNDLLNRNLFTETNTVEVKQLGSQVNHIQIEVPES